MREKIANKLYQMYLFREEVSKDSKLYDIRTAKLNGAVAMVEELGFKVDFNPLANADENPFTIREV